MKNITREQIHRAVASSTAIETEHDTEYWLQRLKNMATIGPKCELKLDPYPIIEEAVEGGCKLGWHRAHKHTDSPDPALLLQYIEDAIMLNISELMVHDDD